MPTPELDVLLPADAIDDSDDYFELSNVQVMYESNGQLGSLLSAYADVSLRVEGRLEPPKRNLTRCLVKKPYRPVDIVIRGVTRFSYGKFTDGEVAIWAQGEAGHYLIRPARHYKDIYDSMVQAVELLYFLADIYSEPRKRGGGPSAQLIFQECAEDERFECSEIGKAEQLFRKHHQFLMMCFLNRAQGIGWSNTPIYQFFKRQYPKVFESVKARKEGRYDDIPTTTRSEESAAPPPQLSRSVRNRSRLQKPSERPKKDDNWWEAAAIYEFIRSAVSKRALRPGQGHITLDRVAELMTKRYEIDEEEIARHVLLVHAQNLCYKIDHPRSKTASFLADEPIYRELEAGHDLPATEIRRAQSIELRPRRDYTRLEKDESDSSDVESPNEVITTPQRRSDGRKKKGRLSILRPKSSKFSGKGKSVKARKGPDLEEHSSEEADSSVEPEEEAGADSESDSVIINNTPTQALSPNREKRKFIDTGDDEEEIGRRKRAAPSISPESPPSSSEDDTEAAAEADNEAPLPLRTRPNLASTNANSSNAQPKSKLVAPIISTPLPTYEANGPRDSWNCTFDGCSQRIYGASKEIGRQLITEHLEDHAKGRQEVVGVVWRENQTLALPVNNLLKRIREMSESQRPLFPSLNSSSSALQPEPIRRLL